MSVNKILNLLPMNKNILKESKMDEFWEKSTATSVDWKFIFYQIIYFHFDVSLSRRIGQFHTHAITVTLKTVFF